MLGQRRDADTPVILSFGSKLPSLRKHRSHVARSGKEARALIPARDPIAPDTREENPEGDFSPSFK